MLGHYAGEPIPEDEVHGIVHLLEMIAQKAGIPVETLDMLPTRIKLERGAA